MNPAEYDGVEDLPETIDDRSNIMTMGYPPFRELIQLLIERNLLTMKLLFLKKILVHLKILMMNNSAKHGLCSQRRRSSNSRLMLQWLK